MPSSQPEPPTTRPKPEKAVAGSEHLLRFGAIEIFLVEGFVLIVERSELALDEEVAHLGGELERVTVGDYDVSDFAAFQ